MEIALTAILASIILNTAIGHWSIGPNAARDGELPSEPGCGLTLAG